MIIVSFYTDRQGRLVFERIADDRRCPCICFDIRPTKASAHIQFQRTAQERFRSNRHTRLSFRRTSRWSLIRKEPSRRAPPESYDGTTNLLHASPASSSRVHRWRDLHKKMVEKTFQTGRTFEEIIQQDLKVGPNRASVVLRKVRHR